MLNKNNKILILNNQFIYYLLFIINNIFLKIKYKNNNNSTLLDLLQLNNYQKFNYYRKKEHKKEILEGTQFKNLIKIIIYFHQDLIHNSLYNNN